MMTTDWFVNWIIFGWLAVFSLVMAVGIGGQSRVWCPQRLLLGAVFMRIVGATARYEVLYWFYQGRGDALRYYRDGLRLAEMIWAFETSPFSLAFWTTGTHGPIEFAGSWWGSHFIINVSGVVLSIIGQSIRGEFLVFSLLSFIGLFLIATAFRKVGPSALSLDYARWIWLWPSLWFWPSSPGKDSLLLLAIGVTTFGYAGEKGIRWPAYLLGLGLTFAIRPHVAMALILATLAAEWFASWKNFTFRRLVEACILMVLVIYAYSGVRTQLGLPEGSGVAGILEFAEYRASQTIQGGSAIWVVPIAAGVVGGLPFAFMNVWMRPFPWEVHNFTALISAAEIVLFWTLFWRHRQSVGLALRNFRKHRLLAFAVSFLLIYTAMIGLTFGNLGILARQRAVLFPFVFMLVFALPVNGTKRDATSGS